MVDKIRYHNLSHVGVKYVRDQLLMLPHTRVNWRLYESVHQLLPTLVDDCVDSYTCRFPLIYFPVVEWYYPERVRRQFGLLQSVPSLLSEVLYHIH
jgi:Plant mobile domain